MRPELAAAPTLPDWVQQARRLPLAFAQVREDAALDLRAAGILQSGARIAMVASGGCTAAALAACSKGFFLHLVDPNPAQIALSRLKLRLLYGCAPKERLALLGHSWMPSRLRRERLKEELAALGYPEDILGPAELLAQLGPDHMGRYEALFAQLRLELGAWPGEIEALLRLSDPAAQGRRLAPDSPLGRALECAWEKVCEPSRLAALFGPAALSNPLQSFSSHFSQSLRRGLGRLPAASNPYLAQFLRGRFSAGCVYPWLDARAPARPPAVACSVRSMAAALETASSQYDLIHLSNILDWLPQAEAQRTLDLAWKALRPGGQVLIRQLNSSLDIPALGRRFSWEPDAEAWQETDRSLIYRAIHLGRKS